VFHALTGSAASGGLGSVLLPIILVASLVVVSALAIVRRRRMT
jgi:hypothetical protein